MRVERICLRCRSLRVQIITGHNEQGSVVSASLRCMECKAVGPDIDAMSALWNTLYRQWRDDLYALAFKTPCRLCGQRPDRCCADVTHRCTATGELHKPSPGAWVHANAINKPDSAP
jgi:hypothetical protein